MKKLNIIQKLNIIVILIFAISILFTNYSYATVGNSFSAADEFLEKGNSVDSVINPGALKETSSFMFKLLTSIGIVVMFVVGTVIGIQFMIASAEDKAKVKEALVPYVIGCAVIFGAFAIWSIAVNLGQNISGQSGSSSPTGTGSTLGRPICSKCNHPQPEGYDEASCSYCGNPI